MTGAAKEKQGERIGVRVLETARNTGKRDIKQVMQDAQDAQRELDWLTAEHERINTLLIGVGGLDYTRVRGGSGLNDRLERLLTKKWDIEERIMDAIAECMDRRSEALEIIEGMNHRDIARAYFLDGMTCKDIAREYGYSYGYVRNLISGYTAR